MSNTHSTEDALYCSNCGKCFKSVFMLKRHEKRRKCECPDAVKVDQYTVIEVPVQAKGSIRLEKRLKCDICRKVFIAKRYMTRHLRRHRIEKPFPCTVCGKSFKDLLGFNIHMKVHAGMKPHECKEKGCFEKFSTRNQLLVHRVTHMDEGATTCQICGKMFVTMQSLKEHKKRHNPIRPFSCSICDSRFHTESDRREHVLRHTGNKTFHCTECDLSFYRGNELRAHKVKHTGELRFQCKLCPRAFKWANSLSKHVQSHNHIHSCDQCDFNTHSARQIKEHVKIHDPDMRYTCEICGMKCKTIFGLNKHCDTHTKQAQIEKLIADTKQ